MQSVWWRVWLSSISSSTFHVWPQSVARHNLGRQVRPPFSHVRGLKSDSNRNNNRGRRDVGSETLIINKPSWDGKSTGREASPRHCTRLSFVGGLLPAAPIPIPISSKRQPPNRTTLLPSWRGLMSYRGDGLGPEQKGDTFFSRCPPLPSRSKAAASGETSRICRTEILEIPECAIWAVTRLLPPEPVPTQLHPEQ